MIPRRGTSMLGVETTHLLDRCRQGDQEAWERLVHRYDRLVSFVARSNGLTPEQCADVVQTTFAELLTQLDRLTEPSQLSAWLATVARRTAWRVVEQQQRLTDLATAQEERVIDLTDRAPDALDDLERREWLQAGLDRLDGPCRHLLTALFLDPSEPSYEEVAARLGRPCGSVGPTRRRCLEKLRAELDRLDRIPSGSVREGGP